MPRDVRILLLGDPSVGKTSLIMALVTEEFPDFVPPRAEEITIPAEVTPEHVPTHIVDYSVTEQDEEALHAEIMKSNVICVVYSVDKRESVENITTYWLPLIRSKSPKKPVILVGNKIDLEATESLPSLTEAVLPIMDEFLEVETCVECSARTLMNISEVFYFAQKAVLHPSEPLYSAEEKQLKPECVAALSRVFKVCDYDKNGALSDRELNDFQCRCFNAPLMPNALEEVKETVKRNLEGGVTDQGLTLNGFLYLHLVFIQRGRHETTWTVLRRFGYDLSLQLQTDYLEPPVNVPAGCSLELSGMGVQYLRDLFHQHDVDLDGCLSTREQERMFELCPHLMWNPQDLMYSVNCSAQGYPTLDGFLSYWVIQAMKNHRLLFQFLAYNGYIHGDTDTQLTAVKVKAHNPEEQSVFHCAVVGACKPEFMHQFVNPAYPASESGQAENACRSVNVGKVPKHLLLHNTQLRGAVEPPYHAAVVLVDTRSAQSIEDALDAQEQLGSAVPVLFVNVPPQSSRADAEAAPAHSLQMKHNFLPGNAQNEQIFQALAQLALNPTTHLNNSSTSSWLAWSGKAALYVGVPLALAFAIYKYRSS